MEDCAMLVHRFLKKTEFDSYEDFKANYALNVPEHFSFPRDVVDEWAKTDPEKRALVWCNDEGESREFTFSEVSSLSRRAAHYLSSAGIKRGDRVMLILKRRWECWITLLALHRIGAAVIPAAALLREEDIVYRTDAANIKMIIAVNDPYVVSQVEAAMPLSKTLEKIALVGGRRDGWLPYGEEFADCPEMTDFPVLDKDEPLLIYFTSGTTGMPKMVVHGQRYPLGHITTARHMQCVIDNGLHLTVSDSGWAKFAWGCIYGQWICGSAVLAYDMEKFNARNLIDVIREFAPTTLCVPPTIYRFMLKEGLTKNDFKSVQHFSTAGEPLAPEINREFESITGHLIHEGFGQSEGTVLVCSFSWFEPKLGSVGKPSPIYDIAIVDENGKQCKIGEAGEIVIRSLGDELPPGLICGYFIDGKITRTFDSVYHTGDIAWMDEDGYYWYVGRNDDVIKSSGYRIGPFEVESVLLTHPAVLECAITAVPDPMRGQIVCATIVLSPGYSASDELTADIQKYVKDLTAPYKYPRIVRYVNELPKTTSGKISRVEIRKETSREI